MILIICGLYFYARESWLFRVIHVVDLGTQDVEKERKFILYDFQFFLQQA